MAIGRKNNVNVKKGYEISAKKNKFHIDDSTLKLVILNFQDCKR